MIRDGKADAALGVCTALLAMGYIFASRYIPSPQIVDPIGPRLFPVLIGTGLLISSGLLFIEVWIRNAESLPVSVHTPARHWKPLLGALLWTIAYYVAFQPAGYLLSTFLYLIVMLSFFNRGRHWINAILALSFSVLLYVLFTKLLDVSMPRGVLPF